MVQNNYVWTPDGAYILPDPPPPVLPIELQDYSYYNARIEHPHDNPGQGPTPPAMLAAHPMPVQPAAPAPLGLTSPTGSGQRLFLACGISFFILLVLIALLITFLALEPRMNTAHKVWIFVGVMLGLLAVCLTIAWFPRGSR
jgi:hypothetical protein